MSSVRGLFWGRLSSVRSSVEELSRVGAVPRPRSWDGAPAIFLPPVRTRKRRRTRTFPAKPCPNDRAYGTGDSRHGLVGDHAGGTRGAVAKWDDALREVTTFSFSIGFV